MARSFKPESFYYHKDTGEPIQIQYQNITELRKKLKTMLEDSQGELTVYRHRRGEWGEWFETYEFNHKRKPVIVKSGWM